MTDEWRSASVAWRLDPVTRIHIGIVDAHGKKSRCYHPNSAFARSVRPFLLNERECPTCHTSFMPEAPNQKYCNPTCRGHIQAICANLACGKPFNARPGQRFCSCRCAGMSLVTPENNRHRACANPACGKLFRATRKVQRTCSRACGFALRALTRTTCQGISHV